MAEAGTVGLDDPAERWLPAPPGTGITLLNPARHTSGLPGCRPASDAGTRTRPSRGWCAAWTPSSYARRARRSTPTSGTPSSARRWPRRRAG
ncbi:serine hydrolase [Streptomyces sp. NPDC006309]|uniref:serine hydrolase n=1 Tax=Streptomyces sp. NPDC006309 TaxID=3156749 RepID=UPI0033B4A541